MLMDDLFLLVAFCSRFLIIVLFSTSPSRIVYILRKHDVEEHCGSFALSRSEQIIGSL